MTGDSPGVPSGGPRRFGTVWLALAVVVGLLLGYAAGLLTPSLRAPGDGSAEAGFARDMTTHHTQAVELALIAYPKATDPELRDVAYDIATGQQYQIGVMQRWLEEWGLNRNSSQPKMAWMPDGAASVKDGLMPGMATNDQISKLREATGRDVDILFAQLMIRHHIGGVHMIDGVLERSDRPEVVELARSMKGAQQREIAILTALLERLGARPL